MSPNIQRFVSLCLFSLMLLATCLHGAPMLPVQSEPIRAVPVPVVDYPGRVALGEQLFFSPLLSADGSTSCGSCHRFDKGGADGLRRGIGINQQEGAVNTPTVFNARFNLAQFWDGRASTLEQQAGMPIHNPLEMGSDWDTVIAKLRQQEELVKQFERRYGELTAEAIEDAIARYERTLVTLDAPFDRYLKGDRQALTAEQVRGYSLFKEYGCVSCHQGINVGGNLYQKMGLIEDYFALRSGAKESSDLGRFNHTGRDRDRHLFKVPSLRLASQTAPYFHDGSVATLEEAVRIMGKVQLGRDIPESDIDALVAFIESLAGEYRRVEP